MEKQEHLYEHASHVTPEQRTELLKQRGIVVWFTGLSGSGKSTVAHALELELIRLGHPAFVLDGDNLRRRLNSDLGFTEEDRHENIRRVAEVASLFADAGIFCITAFISPFRADRDKARAIIGVDRMYEVYLSTTLEECEERDPKGLYAKARKGEIPDFTGITSPYEPPESPELEINTTKRELASSVEHIISYFRTASCLLSETE